MAAKILLLCVLILESISGVVCYDYNVGGMVAAAVAAFIFLIAIVLMIIIAVLWRDWYMNRQASKGRYRLPRERWHPFSKSVSQETPRSDQRIKMRMYNTAPTPHSNHTTLDRQANITDQWVTRLPPSNYYEEKSKTLKFEPEEENVIVADILPETNRHSTQPVVITTSGPELSRQTVNYRDSKTTYVPLKSDSPTQVTQMRQTTPAQHFSYEPYHVQVKMSEGEPARNISQTTRQPQVYSQTTKPTYQLSKTMPAGRGNSDIYIQPSVPSTSQMNDNPTTNVVYFDSDEEAGNVPTRQMEDVVLF